MATEVYMPKAGMDMKEGVIIRWLVEEGAPVAAGDPLLEIETDKVTMEVESPGDGVLLCRYYDAGETVPVVTVIGYVGAPGEQPPPPPQRQPQPQEAPPARPEQQAEQPAAAPAPDLAPETGGAHDWDVAVIGGGPAGYVAAIRAAQMGGRVVLFERERLGGTCLNRGCIPTKTYLGTAESLRQIRSAGEKGIVLDAADPRVDLERLCAHKERIVDGLVGGVSQLLASRKVEVVRGEAALDADGAVLCGGERYEAGAVLLCGGSRPGRLPIPGCDGARVLTSDEILALRELPRRLAVIGGGVIGCELSQAFAAFGSEVTILEAEHRLLPGMDEELSAAVGGAMERAGVRLHLDCRVREIVEEEGQAAVLLEGGERVPADFVLLSVGRVADLSCLGALADRVAQSGGKIRVDDHCRTNLPGLYACGDLTNAGTLAHAAFAMGVAAAETAMGSPKPVNLRAVPACVYTHPGAAGVGLTEAEAASRCAVAVGRFPFAANGRALAGGEPEGFVKVVADRKYGEILGVHIVGAAATELIAEAKVLIDGEITVHEAAGIIHPHPTFAEALAEACADALGRCIHLPAKPGPRS